MRRPRRKLNAWPEGSVLDATRYPIDDDAADRVLESHSLSVAVTGFEHDFPLLALAAHRVVPAFDVKVSWLDDKGIADNYMQILRTPWTTDGDPEPLRDQRLWDHMAEIEYALGYGVPGRYWTPHPLATCGGIRHYLGAEHATCDAVLILRPLVGRELAYRSWPSPGGGVTAEWLSELSLEVHR